jgi:hypothetical protein
MNESVFDMLTRGGEKGREQLLNSLRGIKGVKEKEVNQTGEEDAATSNEDAVTLRVERRTVFYVGIRPAKPSAVERVVTEYESDWSTNRANAKDLVEKVFAHLGSGKSDRLPQYVIVEIRSAGPLLYLSGKPEPLYLNLGSGKAVVLERFWGQKARSPGTGISTVAILDKRVSVKDLCDLIDRLVGARDEYSYNITRR